MPRARGGRLIKPTSERPSVFTNVFGEGVLNKRGKSGKSGKSSSSRKSSSKSSKRR